MSSQFDDYVRKGPWSLPDHYKKYKEWALAVVNRVHRNRKHSNKMTRLMQRAPQKAYDLHMAKQMVKALYGKEHVSLQACYALVRQRRYWADKPNRRATK